MTGPATEWLQSGEPPSQMDLSDIAVEMDILWTRSICGIEEGRVVEWGATIILDRDGRLRLVHIVEGDARRVVLRLEVKGGAQGAKGACKISGVLLQAVHHAVYLMAFFFKLLRPFQGRVRVGAGLDIRELIAHLDGAGLEVSGNFLRQGGVLFYRLFNLERLDPEHLHGNRVFIELDLFPGRDTRVVDD